jgi:hypothetical protein
MIEHFSSDLTRWLSNFYPCDITFEGKTYTSIEHAYMSAKSLDPNWKQFCIETEDPRAVKKRSREIKLIPEWENIKVDVMRECVTQKFSKEPFRSKLLDTKNEYIQEGNWWNDRFWGVDLKSNPPVGKNMLGILIMEVRSNLITDEIL